MIMAVMAVIMAFMSLAFERGLTFRGGLGRLRVGVVFEGVGRTQRFAFRAQTPRQQSRDLAAPAGPISVCNPAAPCGRLPTPEPK
jgi:hypothetical protein